MEHPDARVAHEVGGVRDQHQRAGELLEREVQAQRQERPVHVGPVEIPQEARADLRDIDVRLVHAGGGGRHLQPQPVPGELGVAQPTPGLQPRRTLRYEQLDEHVRRDGHRGGHGGRLRVAEQRPGHVHEQHPSRRVDDGPRRTPRRETLSAVRATRHRHGSDKDAGQKTSGQIIGRGHAAD